jgi:hypothetical protein
LPKVTVRVADWKCLISDIAAHRSEMALSDESYIPLAITLARLKLAGY